jgi:ABC-type nitrate/sulfonate/bicarbonate transport system substrate-binding protein
MVGAAQAAEGPAPADVIRFAASSAETAQCLVRIGAEAGLFQPHGVELQFAPEPVGAAAAMAGLLEGRWDFAHVGVVPLARQALEGHDAVLLLSPVESHRPGYLMARPEIRSPEQLAGARIGVLSTEGESAVAVRSILQGAGAEATLVALGTPRAVYEALRSSAVDAGWLPPEPAFDGRKRYRWTTFEGGPAGIPGGIATTRRYLAAHPQQVDRFIAGCIDAIHFFKSQVDAAAPLLARCLDADRSAAQDLCSLYAPLLRPVPRPTLFSATTGLRAALASRYPQAESLAQSDLIDASFVNRLEESGYIRQLYTQPASDALK